MKQTFLSFMISMTLGALSLAWAGPGTGPGHLQTQTIKPQTTFQKNLRIKPLNLRVIPAPQVTDPGTDIYSGRSFRINWTEVQGATEYEYQFTTDRTFRNASTQTQELRWGTHNAFNPTVTQSTIYYFRVRAKINQDPGMWSNTVDMTVLPEPSRPELPPIPAPHLTCPSQVLSDQMYTLTWNQPSQYTDWYYLEQSTSSNFNPVSGSVNLGGRSYAFHHEVTQPTTYYYRVRANPAGQRAEWSNVASVIINPRSPAFRGNAPTVAPTLTDPGERLHYGDRFTLRWTAVPGATSYECQSASDHSFSNPQNPLLGDAQTTSASLQAGVYRGGDQASVTYFYRVRARNNDGSGPWSNAVDLLITP